MEHDTRLPGVTFHLEDATIGASEKFKGKGRVVLTADVDDLDMWDTLVSKLNEMRVYESEGFKEQMLSMLQQDSRQQELELVQARAQIESLERRYQQHNELEAARYNKLEIEYHQLVQQTRAQQKELERLRSLGEQFEALSNMVVSPDCPSDGRE